MDYEELRPVVLEYLKNHVDKCPSLFNILNDVIIMLYKRGFYPDLKFQDYELDTQARSSIFKEDRDKIRQIIWELIFQGVLYPGVSVDQPNLPFLSITEYGKQVLMAGEILPYDPDGYLKHLKSEIPTLDPLIEIYVTESLQAYLRGLMFSSAVTLGVASEKTFLLLLEELTNAITDPKRKLQFTNLQYSYRTKIKFDIVKQEILHIRNNLPRDINDVLETHLDGIFNLIRVTRNDAGHPTGKGIKRDVSFVNLRLFVPYCKTVYNLINHLQNNPIP